MRRHSRGMDPAVWSKELTEANLETVDIWKLGNRILHRILHRLEMRVNYDGGHEPMNNDSHVHFAVIYCCAGFESGKDEFWDIQPDASHKTFCFPNSKLREEDHQPHRNQTANG